MKEEETEENLKEVVKYQTEGVVMETLGVVRGLEFIIYILLENFYFDVKVRFQSMFIVFFIYCMLKFFIIILQIDNFNIFILLC